MALGRNSLFVRSITIFIISLSGFSNLNVSLFFSQLVKVALVTPARHSLDLVFCPSMLIGYGNANPTDLA